MLFTQAGPSFNKKDYDDYLGLLVRAIFKYKAILKLGPVFASSEVGPLYSKIGKMHSEIGSLHSETKQGQTLREP